MKNLIIAFTGPKGCGKSTAAKHLVDKGFVRHYFAKPLKEMMKCLGLTEEHVNGSIAMKEAPCDEVLDLCQSYGAAGDLTGQGSQGCLV